MNENYLLNKPLPWLSFEAIEYIQPRVKEGMKVFEYGSGGSTLFWLHHKAIVTSVEHDTQWYQKTKSYLAKLSTPQRVDYRQISRESLDAQTIAQNSLDYNNPDNYSSERKDQEGYSFKTYATQIDEFPDGSFDIVLIDGRVRNSCIKHAYKKVKIGGMIILDNSDRPHYLSQTSHLLKDYEAKVLQGVTPTSLNNSQTTIFTRRA